MAKYPYILATNHIVADIAGIKVLLDTGSPETLGTVSQVTLAGRSFPVNQNVPSALVAQLRQEVGTHVDVLLGCDVMENFDIAIDPDAATVTFLTDRLPTPATAIQLRSTGVPFPVMSVCLAGNVGQAVFDSGAHISYVDRKRVGSAKPVETVQDFHISLGNFTTPIYELPLCLGKESMPFRFGVLPEGCWLAQALTMYHADAIVGSDLLRTHAVTFSLRNGWLELVARATGEARHEQNQ